MKNKINNAKRIMLTVIALVVGSFASNLISESGVLDTAYANPTTPSSKKTALDSYLDLDIKFDGSGDSMTVDDSSVKSATTTLNSIIKFIKWIALGGTFLLLGVFIVNLIKMGAAGTNINSRAAAQQGLIWSGVSAAVLSIATSVFFFLQGVLK